MNLKKYLFVLSVPFIFGVNSFSQNFNKFISKETKEKIYFSNKYEIFKNQKEFFIDTIYTNKTKIDTFYENKTNEEYLNKIIKIYSGKNKKEITSEDFNILCKYIDKIRGNNNKILDRMELKRRHLEAIIWESEDFRKRILKNN